ncbi:MAG: hypothetical protein R3B09_19680 [Nannocystaceae bacterium]
MSPRTSALLALLLALDLACAKGEHYDSSGSGVSITGASATASESGDDESDSESGISSAAQTGPWTSASASNGSSPTTNDSSWTATVGTTWDGTTWDTWDTWDSSTGVDSTSGSTTDDPTSTTDPGCDAPCNTPPGPCHDPAGVCINGNCEYTPKDAGLACDDGDECTIDDECDGIGACVGGDTLDCSPPAHAKGGTCKNGKCTDFTCVAPYENCDGKWENGCEVPTKIANQCDKNGISPNGGCWTAYCGSSNDGNAHNFGTYYCSECSTCHSPSQGMQQWCDHDNGVWYPAAAGSCGTYLDLVCPAL